MAKNKVLYKYHLQLQEAHGDVMAFLLGSRIKDFYKNNGLKIQSIVDKIASLQKKYFVIENDRVKMEKIKKEGSEDEIDSPVMLPEMLYDNFMKEYTELMEMDCLIR